VTIAFVEIVVESVTRSKSRHCKIVGLKTVTMFMDTEYTTIGKNTLAMTCSPFVQIIKTDKTRNVVSSIVVADTY